LKSWRTEGRELSAGCLTYLTLVSSVINYQGTGIHDGGALLECGGCIEKVGFSLGQVKTGRTEEEEEITSSSHIRLIRWTLPVSRDIGEHNEQAESTSVWSVQVGHKPGVRVTSSGQNNRQGEPKWNLARY